MVAEYKLNADRVLGSWWHGRFRALVSIVNLRYVIALILEARAELGTLAMLTTDHDHRHDHRPTTGYTTGYDHTVVIWSATLTIVLQTVVMTTAKTHLIIT